MSQKLPNNYEAYSPITRQPIALEDQCRHHEMQIFLIKHFLINQKQYGSMSSSYVLPRWMEKS